MIFNQPAYFALIAASALAFRFLPARVRPWWLAATGLLFYAYFSPEFVAILLAEMVLVYVLGMLVRRDGRRGTLAFAVGITLTVGVLAFFKYSGMLTNTAITAGVSGLPTFADVRLPLAISFFTFEFVHYLVDARRRTLPDHAAADFAAFALFIPTMVAGPIKRFQGFAGQARDAKADAADVDHGVRRIIFGLAKKIVLADTLTLWIAPLGSDGALAETGRLGVVVALLAYALRIYFDFSAYSDIAIGSARLFGISVPENFDWPYLRTNIAQFWRHWHMSLTRWITDYIYIPLGGSRVGLARQCVNVVVAMTVSGLWHGAAWHFVVWGLYHGLLMAAHRVWRAAVRPPLERLVRFVPPAASVEGASQPWPSRALSLGGGFLGGVVTFTLVTLGWGLFAMPLSRFSLMLQRLAAGGGF